MIHTIGQPLIGRGIVSFYGGSVAERLACWTQVQKARVQIAVATLPGNSLRQTAHTHCASVQQAAKSVAALLRVAGVTAGLAESNGSLPPGVYDSPHLQADCQEPGSAQEPYLTLGNRVWATFTFYPPPQKKKMPGINAAIITEVVIPVTSARAARLATDDRSTAGARRSELPSLVMAAAQS